MKAIILSAGEGSRMRPLTLTKPKTMLPVAGKPIMQYNIESLRDNGIKDILLIVRYKEEMVRDYFGDGSDFGVNITYKTQTDFLGTANAISYGEDFIEDSFHLLIGIAHNPNCSFPGFLAVLILDLPGFFNSLLLHGFDLVHRINITTVYIGVAGVESQYTIIVDLIFLDTAVKKQFFHNILLITVGPVLLRTGLWGTVALR